MEIAGFGKAYRAKMISIHLYSPDIVFSGL